MKLSVLVPTHNEQETIQEILSRLQAVDLSDLGLEKEIVVVDDGSTDDTQKTLQGLDGQKKIRMLCHEYNQGKGAAVRTALKGAMGDILLIQDADLEYDPRDFPALLDPIMDGRSNVVY